MDEIQPQGGYLTPEQMLENAPKDIVEQDVEGVFGGKVRVRSLTAAQSAKVQQAGIKMPANGKGVPQVSLFEAEVAQFEAGVVQPQLTHNQVVALYQQSGSSFKKVCQAIDEISGTDLDEFLRAQEAFQGPEIT